MKTPRIAVALSGLFLAACTFDVGNLNQPGLDQILANPTPAAVEAVATGLLAGHRADMAERIGYVSELGILGRESLVLAGSDDRFVTEMLNGITLDPSTTNFGGNFWRVPYANIRNANLLLDALFNTPGLVDQDKEAIRGFAKTMMALDFLKIINTHDVNGAAIDVDLPIGQLAPFVSKDQVFERIALLLDQAQGHLQAAGAAFPMPLSNGFTSFSTPALFIQVNRALAARVAVYRGRFSEALTALSASFIDPATPGGTPSASTSLAPWPGTGAFDSYGLGSGDTQNDLNTPDILVHQSIIDGAEDLATKPPGCTGLACKDTRVQSKVTLVVDANGIPAPVKLYGETSGYNLTLYPKKDSPIPIIRNEELILLRAEANCAPSPFPPTASAPGTCTGNVAAAILDIDYIRQNSGGVPASAGLNSSNLLDELLKQKRYSLLFEGGHRWIDARRYGRANGPVATLPIDQPSIQHVQTAFPIPQSEVDARK
ncbi:MAG: RagB/SusD family nutrient uptake outer membrane protein [Deltaproteobacteria bacterium]|nr:MAG: RagB/SusD family nutrient uptake outer membrane protein [Deltaproteobacteria bacterium]